MSKRHDSLLPLTHDHHHALVEVRKLKAAAAASAEERNTQADEFIHFFDSDTINHFREEEEVVFPLVADEPEVEPVLAQAMMDHLRIHAQVHGLRGQMGVGTPTAETLSALATSLEAHIRFEEKTVFPLIEGLVHSELSEVSLAPRERAKSGADGRSSE